MISTARTPEDIEKSHILGAVNIEWRELLSRREESPEDKPLLLYCNSGSLSAQAAFGLKVTGLGNVYLLTGGFDAYSRLGQLSLP